MNPDKKIGQGSAELKEKPKSSGLVLLFQRNRGFLFRLETRKNSNLDKWTFRPITVRLTCNKEQKFWLMNKIFFEQQYGGRGKLWALDPPPRENQPKWKKNYEAAWGNIKTTHSNLSVKNFGNCYRLFFSRIQLICGSRGTVEGAEQLSRKPDVMGSIPAARFFFTMLVNVSAPSYKDKILPSSMPGLYEPNMAKKWT